MENYTRTINMTNNPKFKMIDDMRNECYEENVTHSKILEETYDEDGPWCGRKFDGWSCWDETPASTTAYQNCPGFIIGFDPNRNVQKICTENGSWYTPPHFDKSWTNYSTCVDMDDLSFRMLINHIYVTGYSVSVAALLASIGIFIYFRSLQCMRIRIHKGLFTSFVLSDCVWILWYKVVVEQVNVVKDNKEWCQVLHVITEYFMVTNYMWMLCESLHLHVALVLVFIREELAMRWFRALGWGISFIIVMVYALARIFATDDTDRCWLDNSDAFYIIICPVGISLMTSFGILINVIRILILKHRCVPHQPVCEAAKKAVRATCILVFEASKYLGDKRNLYSVMCFVISFWLCEEIPLFGLHFIIIPLRPLAGSQGERVYQVVSALITSLQGLCVSVLYCFTNQEVIKVVKAHLSRFQRENEAIGLTAVTAEDSQNNRRTEQVSSKQ